MDQSDPRILVSTSWLSENLSNPHVKVLDASWHLPTENRNAYKEFLADHINGAQFFDIDRISDQTSDLPHMVPPALIFDAALSEMGISSTDHVVVYDTAGLFSAARVWWLFKTFGLNNISVLDGGFPKWKADGYSTTDMLETPVETTITTTLNDKATKDAANVLEISRAQSAQIIDARAPARFKGEAPEPRAGLRSGHIPNSVNVFYKSLLNDDNTVKTDAELRQAFHELGVDLDKPIVTSCGSGVTAAILSLALAKVGHTQNTLYDGSWSEWGALYDYPIEQG